MHYDNIEIGTSDFRTLIESADGNGISVEPIKIYFDNLPERKGWIKENLAISDTVSKVDAWYVDPDLIDDLPRWVRGCNSIGEPHPTIQKRWPKLLKHTVVHCIRMIDLYQKHEVTSVGFLKIDTEGMDYRILMDYFGSGLPMPDKLEFESNELMKKQQYEELVDLLSVCYSNIERKRFNTICE